MAKLFQLPFLFEDVSTEAPGKTDEPSSVLNNAGPPDWLARSQALDIRRSWIVEAPAGSGKTGLLIRRLLKLLADETVTEPEQVLAITFTRAATKEMRDRVLGHLEDAHADISAQSSFDVATSELARRVLDRDRELGWNLIQHPRRLNIRTIDSVCAQILSGFPIASGGMGRIETVDNPDDLYREAARNVLLRLGGPDAALDHALRTLLRVRDGDLGNCERLLAEMLRSRDQWSSLLPPRTQVLDDDYFEEQILPRLNFALEQVICAELTRLQNALPEPLLVRLTEVAADLSNRPGHNDNRSTIAVCSNRYHSPAARVSDLEHWRALLHLLIKHSDFEWRSSFNPNYLGFRTDRGDKARLQSLVAEAQETPGLLESLQHAARLPPAEYPEEQWKVVKALLRILREALGELQLVFAQHGRCDFAENALQASSVLRRGATSDDLRSALGSELRHLLVDEMQDTSSSQYGLIRLLTQHWDQMPRDRRTLFLVGDPKQSIYLFRQARVERFLRTTREQRLGSLALGRLHLTSNFRSQAGLIDHFNHDFSRIFLSASRFPGDDAAITFRPVEAVRPAATSGADAARVWHTSVLAPPDASVVDLAREQARTRRQNAIAIRSLIVKWRARPLPPGRSDPWRVAVLVRARQHLFEIVAALRGTASEAPIPYRAINIEQLGERPEILDLLALTRAVLNPADRIAWLSLLRAPWCGLEVAELHLLTGSDDPVFHNELIETLIGSRAHLLASTSQERLRRLSQVMESAAAQSSTLALAQLVERTWRSLGGHLPLSADEQTNVQRFFTLLDQIEESTGHIDVARLARQVEALYAEPSAESNAVDLMTIHQAKGLEWDFVIVPSLERFTSETSGKLLTWEEIDTASPEAAHVLLAPIHGRGEDAQALNRWIADLAKEREAEERKRLFYVACTRAREELHLFADVELTGSGAFSVHRNSLLSAAWPAAKEHFGQIGSDTPADQTARANEPEFVVTLAASAEEATKPSLYRLPDGIDVLTGHPMVSSSAAGPVPAVVATPIERSEGSLPARTFGNTVHTLLQWLTEQSAAGSSPADLLARLPTLRKRTIALLRSGGIAPSELERLNRDVQTSLTRTLTNPIGLWLVQPRPNAASELSLSSWRQQEGLTIRVDRIFTAGNHPLTEAGETLWLIDYKTATHGRVNLQQFLLDQRARYADQLERYAQLLRGYAGTVRTRVALYFPMLAELVWWDPDQP